MALLAVSNVFFNYNLAHFRYSFLLPLAIGIGLFCILIFLNHDNSLIIAKILLLTNIVIFVGTLINNMLE
jgi:hypothetical protein